MLQKKLQKIIIDTSIKYKLPEELIEDIYNSQWKKLREVIREGKYETIQFPNWGKYYPSIKKLKYIKDNMKKIRNESEIDRKIEQYISR